MLKQYQLIKQAKKSYILITRNFLTLREKGNDCEALNSTINVWLMDCLSSGAGVKRGTGVGGVFVFVSFCHWLTNMESKLQTFHS